MPTPIIAQLMTDPGDFQETIEQTYKGYVGERNYKVNTIHAALALTANGLPRLGELFDSRTPNCFCWKIGPSVLIGGQNSGDGSGGWTRMPTQWASPTATPFKVPVSEEDQWTEIGFSRGQVIRLKSLERFKNGVSVPVTANSTINNGDGAPVNFGIVEASIFTFRKLTHTIDLPSYLDLARGSLQSPGAKLNSDPIKLPPLYGRTQREAIDKGQALYISPEFSVIGSFLQIVHRLEISQNFLFHWHAKGFNGQVSPTSDEFADRTYEYADFTPLWRQ